MSLSLDIQKIKKEDVDVLVIGSGGAGLRAALEIAPHTKRVAVASKVFPTRSHTVSAQGGMNAALANVLPDNPDWHTYDTIKGGDYLVDQDAAEFMCRKALEAVYEMEHFGVPFSRIENGTIYQRPFGGQSQEFGGPQAARTCAAADRTGHCILQTLYQKALKEKVFFYNEYLAIDLIRNDEGRVLGALLMSIETSDLVVVQAKNIILATGGVGRLYKTNSNAHSNTGDGMAMALRCGIPVQDMEFFQFHPTGIAGKGMLISESARGEGGHLINGNGERFMGKYAPNAKELASRDVVARAIAIEIREGRGCGPNKDFVYLKLTHLGSEKIKKYLPSIRQMAITFSGADMITDMVPVAPTNHYTMGGIPTNLDGQVIISDEYGNDETVEGLYAIGECACVSVHGANRLGGNSLLDIVVFGKAAGKHIAANIEHQDQPIIHNDLIKKSTQRLTRWSDKPINSSSFSMDSLKRELAETMEHFCSVFRDQKSLEIGLNRLNEINEKFQEVTISDYSNVFNTARVEVLELENLITLGFATIHSAILRQESRGAHTREDYPERDDENFLKHSLFFLEDKRVSYKPVRMKPLTLETFPPKKRVY